MSFVHVAIAIIINQENQVLIARRASHQDQGGKWEFPGGKVEEGESSQDALIREIKEEVDVQIESVKLITNISHRYENKKILLDVYQVSKWSGHAIGREGQAVLWVDKQDLDNYEFPEANSEIILQLQTK